MDNKDILVTEVTENVEQTTEENGEKTYTQTELDEIVGKRLARNSAKIRKEYDRKYGNLENVLKAGTGKQTVEELTSTFSDFYKQKGIEIPSESKYTDREIDILAREDANDIIKGGLEDVTEELDRLSDLGVARMTQKEKAIYKVLAEYHKSAEDGKALTKLGVTEDVYTSKEFKDFSKKFNSDTPITEIYEIYSKTQPKKEVKSMGSMKNPYPKDDSVKDFYTPEEAKKFTRKDFEANPKLYEAIEKSMYRWK